MPSMLEIERRFLVDGRGEKPWRNASEHFEIRQLYLDSTLIVPTNCRTGLSYAGIEIITNLDNEIFNDIHQNEDWVTRVRKKGDLFFFTVKGKTEGIATKEHEFEIASDIFSKILKGKDYPEVVKTRFNWLSEDNMIWEVDEFEGNLAGLIIAEVELPDENHEIELPSWLGMEITYAKGWSNADLAKLVMTAQNS